MAIVVQKRKAVRKRKPSWCRHMLFSFGTWLWIKRPTEEFKYRYCPQCGKRRPKQP